MKRPTLIISILLLLLSLACAGALAEDAADGQMDEWTVMFYFCGSDLESKYSFATGYLADIGMTMYPNSWMTMVAEHYGLDPESMLVTVPPTLSRMRRFMFRSGMFATPMTPMLK